MSIDLDQDTSQFVGFESLRVDDAVDRNSSGLVSSRLDLSHTSIDVDQDTSRFVGFESLQVDAVDQDCILLTAQDTPQQSLACSILPIVAIRDYRIEHTSLEEARRDETDSIRGFSVSASRRYLVIDRSEKAGPQSSFRLDV